MSEIAGQSGVSFGDLLMNQSVSGILHICRCILSYYSHNILSVYDLDFISTGGLMPYIDSRSTSSGTSDMSDYIETLSLSSYSSSDTPEMLR